MATKLESDFPSSPPNDESDGEEESIEEEVEKKVFSKPTNNNVQDLLKRLQSSGALLTKPKKEFHCFTCKNDFENWEEIEQHLIQHVSLPSVVIDKLPSDEEDLPHSGDEDWSDEEQSPLPAQTSAKTTPQKVDISLLLKKTGLSLKNSSETPKTSNAALDKLSGLGFTIKKNNSPIKKELQIKQEDKDTAENSNNVMQKLGKLGGIKLKLRSDGTDSNSFKVVNGLRDFKTSDEEDEEAMDRSAEHQDGDSDEDQDRSGEQESAPDNDSEGEEFLSRSNQTANQTNQTSLTGKKIGNTSRNTLNNLQGKTMAAKEPKPALVKPNTLVRSVETLPQKQIGRSNIKQTPKRGANLPLPSKEPMQIKEISTPSSVSSNSTPERRQSSQRDDFNADNVVIKQEIDAGEPLTTMANLTCVTNQIKSERSSPPPVVPTQEKSTPVIASIKSEPDLVATGQTQPLFSAPVSSNPPALLPITKTEDTIIEINGDSNDEDDDCCVVSATPATDVKPVIPKTEPLQPTYPPPAYPVSSQPSYSIPISTNQTSTASALEKQHNFNWNAPDSKPTIDILEKSADEIFESLLSSVAKKENNSLSDASEYISLDTLGPQHSCNVCNTRFTDISLLDDHIRMTGHSRSIVTPSTSTLMPYNNHSSSSILQSLLPVKQMVEQVGKIGMGAPGFTHQQNVMINIQAYPGSGGMMAQQPPYNSYGSSMAAPNLPGYGQTSGNMYTAPGQMPGQYSNQNFMGQQPYNQFQNSMPMSQNSFDSSSMYSSATPLQSMQQSVYGTQVPSTMASQVGQMGPPPVPMSNPYIPTSSPGGTMKPPTSGSGIRIQNIQTFAPGPGAVGQTISGSMEGQLHGMQQVSPGLSMPAPGQIKMAAGASMAPPRPRMPNIRGQRPTIRPGIQVHGQIRGAKPRMPMKRPGNIPTGQIMKKKPNILMPGKHDNEDCQVMSLQKQQQGLPMIKSVQGANERLNLGSQISITKKTVNKEANAMANVLASRGISIKQKQKSRSPSPDRPLPHIPNLGAGMSIKHTSKSSSFSIPEAKVGGGMLQCKICKKMFMNPNSLSGHMSAAHPQSKMPMFKCEECPASYPKILQLQHHKRVFHNVVGPNRELGLPVVDMSMGDNLKRLSNLGIYSFIPLASRETGGGCFGIPVLSVHNAQNGLTNSLQALGADGLLSLGPLKPLPDS